MQRIATPTAVNGQFIEGNPAQGIPATEFSDDWCNAIQNEIAAVVEGTDGMELDALNSAQLLEAIHRILGRRRAYPNELANGEFQLWQRGTTFAVGNTEKYGPDRFFLRADTGAGTGAATVSRQLFGFGTNTVPDRPEFYLRFLQSAGATAGAPRVGQRIDRLDQFFGERLSVSFWAKGDASFQPTLKVDRNFGTGGSATDNVHSETFAVNTIWNRFTFTVDVPAYTSQTVGPFDFLEVRIELPQSTILQLDVADWLVQFGNYATRYPRCELAVEALRCQRYYEKSYQFDVAPGVVGAVGYSSTDENAQAGVEGLDRRFRVEKRRTPTVTWYSPSTGASGQVEVNGADQPVAGTVGVSTSTTGYVTIGAGTGTDKIVKGHWTAEAEL